MSISALDESGQPVDWLCAYKVPKLSGGTQCDSATGYEYSYFDSAMDAGSGKVARSDHRLCDAAGAIYETLQQLLQPNVGYILYNDERPDGIPDKGEMGHTKGVLCWDATSNTGFWLIHSWPLFPVIGS